MGGQAAIQELRKGTAVHLHWHFQTSEKLAANARPGPEVRGVTRGLGRGSWSHTDTVTTAVHPVTKSHIETMRQPAKSTLVGFFYLFISFSPPLPAGLDGGKQGKRTERRVEDRIWSRFQITCQLVIK